MEESSAEKLDGVLNVVIVDALSAPKGRPSIAQANGLGEDGGPQAEP